MSQPRDNSEGNISFSWEMKPGVSKVTHSESLQREQEFLPKLPLPPCTAEAATAITRNLVHDFQIPLPPCAFQPPYYRNSSKKGLWVVQDEDPFIAAHKECIKNQTSADRNKKIPKIGFESRLRKCMSYFSCK
ncbi:PREDICTED: uncharacterized protein LOC109337348 [Lupinus angustifolius]|uniref:uncharacterized protein LOC109337348 n=1 Tax=Lupinus angustifolius TaxID=3871 RepID=UPI00092F6ACB|nr:PREDICTED: uncharacterized protein LOC109337348 [Lupinus angustifolius]